MADFVFKYDSLCEGAVIVDRDDVRRNDLAITRDAVCKSLRPAP